MSLTSFSDLSNLKIGDFSLGRLCSAAITLLICLLVIHCVGKVFRRLLERSRLDRQVQRYLTSGLRFLLYVIAVLIVADSLGIPVTSLVALLSVGSSGLTLAAEDILGNMAGGLVILSSHPFAIGDFIEASGTSGTVREITLNHTKLETLDGLTVLLPNKALSASQMTNYTVLGRRRVARKITASYDAPTETVKAACRRALTQTEGLLDNPAPSVYLTDYQSSAVEYTVYCWTAPEKYWDVYLALGERLRDAFADAGVEMTYNHLNVHILESRSAKDRGADSAL